MSLTTPRKLWSHPDPKSTQMWKFMQDVNHRHTTNLQSFSDLHAYSIAHRAQFWSDVFLASNLISAGSYTTAVEVRLSIDAIPLWFEGISLNFAENLLFSRHVSSRHRCTATKHDDAIAITEISEGNTSAAQHYTWSQARSEASRLSAALHASGVGRGDRVVLVGGNTFHAFIVFMATAWLGAVFSSSSTDMGTKGILERVVQVNPKMLFVDDSALYNGKTISLSWKVGDVVKGLREGCSAFVGAVAISRGNNVETEEDEGIERISGVQMWAQYLHNSRDAKPPGFVRVPFHEPLLICYSSGTTGMPKAIVHSVDGILISIFKEGALHEDLDATSTTLQYTTTGWIMYLAALKPLLFGSHVILYDGSPFYPDASVLIKIAAQYKVTNLGISPRWLLELAKRGISPREIADIESLTTVTSTGMVLSDQLFEWFYDRGFPTHVHLGNISGGTDIAGCFAAMNPLTPVYAGGSQGPSLGVEIAVYDSTLPHGIIGLAVPDGTPGELVAPSSFPNVPRFLWGDKDGSKFRSAYFARFKHVWAHGDFVVIHPVTKGIIFLGRADGVLNPSGVRFGSAEIYGVIERRFADRVAESLAVGQRRAQDDDEKVMLFLLMQPDQKFDRRLVADIKEAIGKDLSKRHVPKYIFETPEIPTTVNLKKVELPVKQIVSGYRVKPSGTLANPTSLEFYYQFARVEEIVDVKQKL